MNPKKYLSLLIVKECVLLHSNHFFSQLNTDGQMNVFTSGTSHGYLWTWAGTVANQQLVADLGTFIGEELAPQRQRIRHDRVSINSGVPESALRERIKHARELPTDQRPLPEVNDEALDELKFSQALPTPWALRVLETRLITE